MRIALEIKKLEGIAVSIVDKLKAVLSDDHILLLFSAHILLRPHKRRLLLSRLFAVHRWVSERQSLHQRQETYSGAFHWIIEPDRMQHRWAKIDRTDIVFDRTCGQTRDVNDHWHMSLLVI